ncbi:E3 ubiquitin-protein ligase MYCBP2 isoform X3 [Aplysia californica]|uniref:RCR-type E3 ubiquitin transferase n=1 Tax=Aplysia californica TaxID=6500 RepID=A0ABM1VYD5_APLCA|nr:E3 ubiquitin-protein ligase MYCBP2 isoform X3 [Aplysia californica]
MSEMSGSDSFQCFRSQVDLFLKGDNLSRKFHDLFEYKDAESVKKKLEKKKTKKKKVKTKDKKQKREKSPEIAESQSSAITTHGNASVFSVYATVRQVVLAQAIRESTRLYHMANTATDSDSDSDEDGEEKAKDLQIKIPKIVGLGLNGVFELVRESRSVYPELCVKALHALLDLLQGQQPEGMKREPPDIVENLFSLLMDLATNTGDGERTKGGGSMSSLACSALISLTIALGDTEKLLRAITVMLMSRSGLELQDIQVPGILAALQKSVQAVLLGKSHLPDWFNYGIKAKCQAQIFKLQNAKVGECLVENSAIASDGRYLYILNKYGLYKVGSGYGGTVKGKLESQKKDFPVHKNTFLAFAAGKLLCKWDRGNTPSLCVINRATLAPENTFGMDGNSSGHSLLFSDGENIGYIAPAKEEDSFVIRTFSPISNPPMQQVNEVPLKLTRKCMDVMGSTPFDYTYEKRTIVSGFDEDTVMMVSGKEFSLIKTIGGKVLYHGKAASLGIKQSSQAQGKWAELTITKSPKITHIALGHDGLHALMVAEDGSVYFVGTARRGEDGDVGGKVRRQPKPTKPRKMSRLESKFVTLASCNSGTSAVVTRDGELYMFGKDTNHHCDPTSGQVTELRDVRVAQVCLGKAHAVVLSSKGQIYTFGINNKGQCGREFSSHAASPRDATLNITMAEDEEEAEVDDSLCPPGKHKWVYEVCMICPVCRECTGYGVSCINSGRKDRNPGMPCGCGAGDSGCSECGVCRVCGEEKLAFNELDERGLLDVVQARRALKGEAGGKKDKLQLRQAQKLAKARKQREGTNEAEAEITKLVSLTPAETQIDGSGSPAVQIAVGLHHTLVLLQNGDVYAFGSNNNGQLGQGHTKIEGRPTKVPLPFPAVMVAAGSHHSAFLLTSGQIYTCGDHQKGALGRNGLDESPVKSKHTPWYSVPGPVPNVGAKYGRRATWIGASGDQTIMRIDESLINAHTLTRSNIFASKTCIGLIPRGDENPGAMKCLMISKSDGNCKSFSDDEQEDLSHQAVCLDPVYDVLWGYNPRSQEIRCYNVLVSEAQSLTKIDPGYCDIFSPELAVPTRIGCQATRSHCALHMLGCLDTLTVANQLKLQVAEESREKAAISKVYSKEDYTVVNRFESHGGGWGYSGHSVEAIRFMCDTDVLLGGFGLFGGRGGYLGRIKLFELGVEGGENEGDGELLAETEETQFVCGAREKYSMLFDEPVPIQANFWYVAWARISGPSSDCGANGLATVHTEDSVVFKFKSSRKSNNGTDVNAGQLPQLLYKLPPRDSPAVTRKADQVDPAHILSTDFSHLVSPQSLEALLKLLEYSWSALHATVPTASGFKGEQEEVLSDLQRIVFIARACLRLLRTYVADIYPDGVIKKKTPPESSHLAERVGDARDLLRRILAEDLHLGKFRVSLSEHQGMRRYRQMREDVLNECHATFRTCFHAFYPTGHLKWWCLCDLLCQMEPIIERRGTGQQSSPNVTGISRLLAAVMEALCHPAVKLTSLMPINCEPETEAVLRRHSMSIDDNTNAMARLGEPHRYPVLAAHMTCRMEEDNIPAGSHVTFKEVLDRLLMIVAVPVRQLLSKESPSFPPALVANTCALLTTIIGELAASAMGLEMDVNVSSRPMLVTPNRFTRASNTCQWNTGKGSPDGIAFCVDRPGIVMAGICVYTGSGTNEYEVEVLKEEAHPEGAEGPKQSGKPESWSSILSTKGSYSFEDCMSDIFEVKFDRPLPLKEGQKYAVLLKNTGEKTMSGDSGETKVRCTDGTTFTFSSCVQSANGTNIIRGQIPQILYYSTPQEGEAQSQNSRHLMELLARRNAIDICGAICHMATDLLHRAHSHPVATVGEHLGSSHLFSSLLPLALAYAGPVAVQDPRGAVQILYLVQEILPAVSGLTRLMVPPAPMTTSSSSGSTNALDNSSTSSSSNNGGGGGDVTHSTTSQHYASVESEHPYRPACVVNYKVEFPLGVRWMVIEFDGQCATSQPEDSLQLYIPAVTSHRSEQGQVGKVITMPMTSKVDIDPNVTHWPILKKYYGNHEWPKSAVLLPGNEVVFSLETASDYVKDEKASFYGFKCQIVGYEWGAKPEESILMLERELAFLGGMCCSALMKKDIPLPSANLEEVDDDLEVIEEGARVVFESHTSLLEKGFALSQPPTIYQALEGNLPLRWQSNEHSFLKDFVSCAQGTSGGRLARWLQPDSYLDPKQCEIECSREDLKCSWPAMVTVYTKDQYGNLVNVPNLKMEVRAIPVDQQELGEDLKKMRKLSRATEPSDMTFGGHPAPVLDVPYEPILKDRKDLFHAITIMKRYENYSFEELRLASPAVPRPSENMLVTTNRDGTYSASWTPGSVGVYNIIIIIDGVQSGSDGFKVEVKEPPQGAPPPVTAQKSQPPKTRKFVAKYSAGLRIRVSPTLQSEQIGVVPPNCVISFVDETTNDDGMWLRLSRASLMEFCGLEEDGSRSEGWCLEYNQHLDKTLLIPAETPKPLQSHRSPRHAAESRREHHRARSGSHSSHGVAAGGLMGWPTKGPGTYMVTKCGASGHNIRARPSLRAAPIGMVTKGKKIKAVEDVVTSEGVWIRLSEDSAHKYCLSPMASEAWSLVSGIDKAQYMQHESEFPFGGRGQDPFAFRSLPPQSQQGFDFAMKAAQYANTFPGFFPSEEAFGKSKSMPSSAFNFGGITGFQPKIPLPRFGEPPAPDEAFGHTSFPPSPPPPNQNCNEEENGADIGLEEAILADRILRQRQRSGSNPNPFMSVPPLPAHQMTSHQRSLSTRKASDPGLVRLTLQDNKDIPPELQGVPVNELVKALDTAKGTKTTNRSTYIYCDDDVIACPSFTALGLKLCYPAINPRKLARLVGESRANGNGPTPQPSPPGSPKRGSRESSPKPSEKRSSERESLGKDEQFKTPPSSPIPTRVIRGPLQKVDSFDKSNTPTPPTTPQSERSDKAAGSKPPPASGLTATLPENNKNTSESLSSSPMSVDTDSSKTKDLDLSPREVRIGEGAKLKLLPSDTEKLLGVTASSSPLGVPSGEKKMSPVAVVVPTVKTVASSNSTVPETAQRSGQGQDPAVAGGLATGGGVRARFRSPPVSNERHDVSSGSQGVDMVDIGAVGASEGTAVAVAGAASGSSTSSSGSRKSSMFTIGTASPKDDSIRLSPKSTRKDRSRSSRVKRERASSPSTYEVAPLQRARSASASKILDRTRGAVVKDALSPAAAECLRAVFAAFMWHEGIVHDAMACASFLKFHPDLTKEMSKFVKEKKHANTEPRRQRHATESSKDRAHPRRKDNINESRVRFNLEPQYSDVDIEGPCEPYLPPKPRSTRVGSSPAVDMPVKPLLCETKSDAYVESGSSPMGSIKRQVERHKSEGGTAQFHALIEAAAKPKGDKETQLPKTLQHLVHFWEELSESVVQVMSQDAVPPSPAMAARIKQHERREKDRDKEKKMKRRKGAKPAPLPIMEGGGGIPNLAGRAQEMFGDAFVRMFRPPPGGAGGDVHPLAAAAAAGGAGRDADTFCDLCQGMFPHPVTYHMRQAHPGCGKHAGGKGYNSSGIFGGGWAGTCGEGGIGECSWYLLCEKCRERYMKKSSKDKNRKGRKKSMSLAPGSASSAGGKPQNFLSPMEAHHILKNNAQFLLELASSSGLSLPKHNKSRPLSLPRGGDMYLPSVSESGTDPDPFPPVPFQYLNLHNAGNSDSAFAEDFFVAEDERVFLRSGSMSSPLHQKQNLPPYRPRLPTEPRHSPLARSGSLGQDTRPFSQLLPSLKHENTRALLEKQPMTKSAGTSPDWEQEGHKKAFHRSVSEYTSENDADEQEFVFSRAVSVSSRRRNNSGSVVDGGVSLLKHPSAAMTRLISAVEKRNGGHTLQRPVMEFIVQRHDLEGLQLAMKQALRKAMCRVFAMQAMNWLIRSVVQQICLHDLLWFFVDSLIPASEDETDAEEEGEGEAKKKEPKKDLEDVPMCDHPMSDIVIAGKAAAQLPETFHTLLQTISDLMMLLPMGSALQQMAVRCYCLQFMQSDHQFLHESHVFSNLSRILSKSEEEPEEGQLDASMMRRSVSMFDPITHKVLCLKDLMGMTEIKASSRQAMIGSLTDNSTETFWESGDEDRNKMKVLTLICSEKTVPQVIYVHVDNIRDIGNKVSSVTFNAGSQADDLKKVKHVEVDVLHSGWIRCPVPGSAFSPLRHMTVELKGSDQSLRLRQVKILGLVDDEDTTVEVKKGAVQIQQDNCEGETLKVFRILTSQVFGKLVTSPEESESEEDKKEDKDKDKDKADGDNDLKEHMVSILFSRSKLSHMQKQVCNHIVQGIRKEAVKMREEWEHGLSQASGSAEECHGSDVYCFELISMVVALSGSSVGRKYLAQQYTLIHDMFSLLHTATPRIQRQITIIFRRVLPWVKPQVLAMILSIPNLPPIDYNIVGESEGDSTFDPEAPGILDVFLSCVAKSLSVQMKVKSSGPSKVSTTLTLSQCLEDSARSTRWWLRGKMDSGLASSIMELVKEMAAGKLSESWATFTKAAIAETILNMTKLDETHRDPQTCVKTPTLWLALASLCVLDQDHVDRLSSGEWVSSPDHQHGQPRPTCDNHDDGVTPAIILCGDCGNLCAECDRYLHLPRRMRGHQRQVFKEEEEAIKVDLHEGCGRIKLFWVMSLVDSRTFKAMVEFREGKVSGASIGPGTCRFCGRTSNTGLLAIGNVCSDPECQEYSKLACHRMLSCGHLCGGIAGEDPCLPCLHRCRASDQELLKQDADDMCMICFTEALAAAPAIQLACSHVFHLHCAKMILTKRYVGARITFGFSLCPICKSTIEHPALKSLLEPIKALKEDVRRKALMRLEYEGLDRAEAITTPGARFYQDPAGFAMERYAYYVCFKCNKAYYGGEARCDEAVGGGDDFDSSELVCGACSDVSRAQMCAKHGADFLEYKCRYCCSVAVFFCFGTTHFCNLCHEEFQRVTAIPKTNLPHCPAGPKGIQLEGEECPLHVKHPPTGEEFALGCGVCRNAHTF